MKYCTHCGTQLVDEAIVCTNCGCAAVDTDADSATKSTPNPESAFAPNPTPVAQAKPESTLRIIAKILMLISCIFSAYLFLFPLAWTIPMTVHYWKNRNVGTGFKVCSLLFVNTIAGILMLCDNQDL